MNDEQNMQEDLPEPTIDDIKEELAHVKRERDEYLSGWQRSKADFINYKKDEARHLEDIARYGTESVIKELLSIMHTFDLAIADTEKNGGDSKGISLIRAQLEDVLKKRGVEKILVNPGDMFDPAVAEAMMEVEAEAPPGSIVEVLEPGYRLHDKVLRAAKVSVSKDRG